MTTLESTNVYGGYNDVQKSRNVYRKDSRKVKTTGTRGGSTINCLYLLTNLRKLEFSSRGFKKVLPTSACPPNQFTAWLLFAARLR